MKTIVLALTIAVGLILSAHPLFAQQAEPCLVKSVNVANSILSSGTVHAKTTFLFSCTGQQNSTAELTKFVYHIPLTDIGDFEASDRYGSLKVLEGPDYAGVKTGAEESVIGVIFRKGILITNSENTYSATVEFNTGAILKSGSEKGSYSIMPKGVVGAPKVTIVSTGITETSYALSTLDYELNLPANANVQNVPKGCSFDSGKLNCAGLSEEQFNNLEVKWSQQGGFGGGLIEKIRSIFSKFGGAKKVETGGKSFLEKVTSAIRGLIK